MYLQAQSEDYLEKTNRMSDEKRTSENNPRSAEIGSDSVAKPRNWLVPVTLVLLRQCRSYGYELMDRAMELGFESLNPGTLYRTLRKMEKEGLCDSEWETASSGPARRMYSITDAGEAFLDMWVTSLEKYQQSMNTLLQAYRSSGAHS